jgi:hypothetical protein
LRWTDAIDSALPTLWEPDADPDAYDAARAYYGDQPQLRTLNDLAHVRQGDKAEFSRVSVELDQVNADIADRKHCQVISCA